MFGIQYIHVQIVYIWQNDHLWKAPGKRKNVLADVKGMGMKTRKRVGGRERVKHLRLRLRTLHILAKCKSSTYPKNMALIKEEDEEQRTSRQICSVAREPGVANTKRRETQRRLET